jgi:hypothetical protein
MKILSTAIVALLVLGFIGTVAAGPAQGINGKGKAGYLYLFEKDPSTWDIVAGGAWGIMTYHVPDGSEVPRMFVFNGHQLAPDTDFSLIYNADPWPGYNLIVLGKGTSDAFGEVHIMGLFNFDAIFIGDKPAAKIWLVLSSDVKKGQMIGWNPTEYLFEPTCHPLPTQP